MADASARTSGIHFPPPAPPGAPAGGSRADWGSRSMLQHFGVTEETWREGGRKDIHFLQSETPLFLGRAAAALAGDKKVFSRTGDLTSSWELAREYGVTDADGSRPDWGTYFETIRSLLPGMEAGIERHLAWLERLAARARRYLGQGAVRAQ